MTKWIDRRVALTKILKAHADMITPLVLFMWDHKAAFLKIGSNGQPTSGYCAFLISNCGGKDCALHTCTDFPSEGAKRFTCGCRLAAISFAGMDPTTAQEVVEKIEQAKRDIANA